MSALALLWNALKCCTALTMLTGVQLLRDRDIWRPSMQSVVRATHRSGTQNTLTARERIVVK